MRRIPPEPGDDDRRRAYWRSTVGVSAAILVVWFGVSFVLVWYARELTFDFFGWPFSFFMGAQGALIVYVALIHFYSRFMNRLDARHGLAEEDER
ncbi:MAG: DUF4212 domain-containing protein [Lautropia sp.]